MIVSWRARFGVEGSVSREIGNWWFDEVLIFKESNVVTADKHYKSPAHKVIAFLKKGRDGWRLKHQELYAKLRSVENQLRAVSKSRQMWRERAEAAEAEL